MSPLQRIIKIVATLFAVCLAIGIIGSIVTAVIFGINATSAIENRNGKIESSSGLSAEEKKSLTSREYEEHNGEIHLCQLCQNAYKRLCELGVTKIDVLVPDGVGDVMFTPICTEKPIKLLREHFGKKRYFKKVSAVKLRKKMKQLCKSVYDINETTEIRLSAIEKYTSKDCTISILNISLIASVLKCSIEELIE